MNECITCSRIISQSRTRCKQCNIALADADAVALRIEHLENMTETHERLIKHLVKSQNSEEE